MSGDAGLIISGGKDNMVKVWDYPGLSLYISVKEDYTPVCFDLIDNMLLVGLIGYQSEGKICIYEIKEDLKKVQEICDNGTGVNKVLFAPGGLVFGCFENKKIEVWQL
jgi:WD40 repeat protein